MNTTKRVFTVTVECADTPDGEHLNPGYAVRVLDPATGDWNSSTKAGMGKAFESAVLGLLFDAEAR